MPRLIDREGRSVWLAQEEVRFGPGEALEVPDARGSFTWSLGGYTLTVEEGAVRLGEAAVRAPVRVEGGASLVLGSTWFVFAEDDGPDTVCGLPSPACAERAAASAGRGERVWVVVVVDEPSGLGGSQREEWLRWVAERLRGSVPGRGWFGHDGRGGFVVGVERGVAWGEKLGRRLVSKLEASSFAGVEPPARGSGRCGVAAFDAGAPRWGAGLAWERARGEAAGRERSDAGQVLRLVEQVLQCAQDLEPFLASLLALLIENTKAARGLVFLQDAGGELTVAAAHGLAGVASQRTVEISASLVRDAARQRRSVWVEDALEDARYRDRRSVVQARLRSAVVVPLVLEQRTVGVLYLDNNAVAHRFSEADVALVEGFARLVAGPLDRSVEVERARAQARRVEREDDAPAPWREGVVGSSPVWERVLRRVEQFALSRLPVALWGESGTGKSALARVLHLASPRRDGPFVVESAAAIPESLQDSLVFGHEVGAFSGADRAREGLFEQAHGGTLFLDDLDEIPVSLQHRLLRALEDGTVRRLGGSEDRPVDVRVVCASRTSLATLVEEGRLREDVAFRLNALPLELPPLRERAEDVPALIERFAEGLEFTPEARDALVRYRWPGNVRQLENELKRLEAVHGGEGPVGVDALGSELRQGLAVGGALRVGGTLQDAVEALEREILGRELEAAGGNRSLVARRMGLSRGGLRLKMKRYGLS